MDENKYKWNAIASTKINSNIFGDLVDVFVCGGMCEWVIHVAVVVVEANR